MTAPITSLLKPVIVRVLAGGGNGTGFFVAPNLVLTCAHVTGGQTGDRLTVRWLGKMLRATVVDQRPRGTLNGPFPYPDVCLLEIDTPVDNPCALLAPEPPALETRLHSRGFTTTWSALATEEPATFTYEGLHEVEGGVLLKLSSGEAVPGMSGGPLVDLSRGVVCGMLKTSRALNSDQGGWGIPIDAVTETFPEVLAANQAYHRVDRSWREAAGQIAQQNGNALTVDIGSVTEVSQSGRPARVLFTVTNPSPDRIKLSAIDLETVERTRLVEPHHFRAEGLPQYFDLEAHLTPEQDRYELLDLDHVLEPGETEGYVLRLTADEGWRYRLRLSFTWWRLGADDRQTWTSPPFDLSFRIMDTTALLAAVQQNGGDDNEPSR